MFSYLFIFLCVFFSVGSIFPFTLPSPLLRHLEGDSSNVARYEEAGRLIMYKVIHLAGIIGGPFSDYLLSKEHLVNLERRLRTIKEGKALTPAEFFGFKILGALVGVFLSSLISLSFIWVIPGFLLGYFYPDLWLKERIEARQRRIQKELPFALDLITISVEAGLGFESALAKVVEKGHRGPLTAEFFRVLQEIRIGKSRHEALQDMAMRVDHPDIRSFVSTLIQAERLGTSIGKILRVLAEQSRTKRSQRAEAAALRAPVKMLFPLTLFIFPTILLILLGPPILRSMI